MDLPEEKKSNIVLTLLLQSFKDIFFPYLTNRDLGKLDMAINDVNLRHIFTNEIRLFYSSNNIESLDELMWIVKRKVPLSNVHLSKLCSELNCKL